MAAVSQREGGMSTRNPPDVQANGGGLPWSPGDQDKTVLMMICSKSFLKSGSGTIEFTSILNQMSMKLHSKLGGFLRIKTKTFQRL